MPCLRPHGLQASPPPNAKCDLQLRVWPRVLCLALENDAAFALGLLEAAPALAVDHLLRVQEHLERHAAKARKFQLEGARHEADRCGVELPAIHAPMNVPHSSCRLGQQDLAKEEVAFRRSWSVIRGLGRHLGRFWLCQHRSRHRRGRREELGRSTSPRNGDNRRAQHLFQRNLLLRPVLRAESQGAGQLPLKAVDVRDPRQRRHRRHGEAWHRNERRGSGEPGQVWILKAIRRHKVFQRQRRGGLSLICSSGVFRAVSL
mmetsp:Transcript_57725/g.108167  ORF Transcript_57725/g.108167 Transcript_57725/m.108167 type:complete len:260 (-) Transcript_57725:232-1011(-)